MKGPKVYDLGYTRKPKKLKVATRPNIPGVARPEERRRDPKREKRSAGRSSSSHKDSSSAWCSSRRRTAGVFSPEIGSGGSRRVYSTLQQSWWE